jgi:DNA uptake protein ComE-like DNA-binding protein
MRYGGHLFQWLRPYYRPALWTVAAALLAAALSALWFYLRERRHISPLAAESAQTQVDQFESYLERADADSYTSSAENHTGVSTKRTTAREGHAKEVPAPRATGHDGRSTKKAANHEGSSAKSAAKYIDSSRKSTPADTEKSNGKLNINSATKEELLQLYGVGEATAAKIIASRPYRNKRELLTRKLVSQSVYHGISDQLVARNYRDNVA